MKSENGKDMLDPMLVEKEIQKNVVIGNYGVAILYASMGLLMIVISRLLATLPLNTPGFYEVLGSMDHVLGIRYGTSTAFFMLALATLVVIIIYKRNPATKRNKRIARLMAIIQQPWIPIITLIFALAWGIQGFDPSGDFSEIFAKLYGLDVNNLADELHYQYIMSRMPILEFLMFSIGSFVLSPFTWYSSSILMQHSGWRPKRKKRKNFEINDNKLRINAGTRLFQSGVIYILMSLIVYMFGLLLGYGPALLYPYFKTSHYYLFKSIYSWYPLVFGLYCITMAVLYYFLPRNTITRHMTWIASFIQFLIPIFGVFFGIIALRELWYSGKKILGSRVKNEMLISLLIATIIIVISIINVYTLSIS
ncbi:MAG: hypothetical protein ACTSVI_10960 [Promethearchaeota archaeon]